VLVELHNTMVQIGILICWQVLVVQWFLQLIGNNGSQKMNIVAGTSNTSIINETNTELKFGVNETAYFTINTSGVMAGDFNDTSDRNLKENIESISASTDIVKQLRAVTFDWKEITHKNDKDEDIVVPARRNKAGFIAQEVQAIPGLEHAVTGTPYVDGNQPTESLSLDTLPLLAHAIKTIQELEVTRQISLAIQVQSQLEILIFQTILNQE
jgi:hypothetical protein